MIGWIPVLECLFVWRVWVSVVMPYHARLSMKLFHEDPSLAVLLDTKKPPRMTTGGPGMY
jgi:hypothetical protein